MTLYAPLVSSFDAKGFKEAERAMNTTGGKFKNFGKIAAGALAGAAAAVAGFAFKVGKDAIGAASDFNETVSKTQVIFGESSASLEAWSKSAAASFGQSQKQALDAASNFAVMGKAAGLTGFDLVSFSKRLTVLASDMASFANTSPEDAIAALGSGLRGENEPLRRFGVMLNDAALKEKALEMGLYSGKGALDQSAKTLAAYEVILSQTGDAQGDFARTSDGLANSQRTLDAAMADLEVQIGQALAPTFQSLVQWLKSDGIAGIQTFFDTLLGKNEDGGNPYRVNGKQVEAFRNEQLTPTQESFKNLATAVQNMGLAFGKLFDKLEINNPDGSFNKFIDGVAELVDSMTLLVDLLDNYFVLKFGTWATEQDWGSIGDNLFPDNLNFLDRSGNRASSRGGTVININGTVLDPEGTARAVNRVMTRSTLRAGAF